MPLTDRETAHADHQRFQEFFRSGRCFACGSYLAAFEPSQPCVHWYLNPAGFTKKHVPIVAEVVGLFKAQLFMRWVANEDGFAKNINDLRDEGAGRLVELTIRYRDCEWSFSCSEGDYRGHEGAVAEAQVPHYHMQFRFKKQSFVKFNDFHLRLHDDDLEIIGHLKAQPDATLNFAGGQGIGGLFATFSPEEIMSLGITEGDQEDALLSMDTIISADPGTLLSGDDLANLINRARASKVSIASLVPELKNASSTTLITPGPGVVEQAVRGGRNKR